MKSKWTLPFKAVFWFLAVYLFIYMFNHCFQTYKILSPFWELIIPEFARFWGYEKEINVMSLHDNVSEFFKICISLTVALCITLVVLIVDFKRENYNTQLQWLTVCIRYFICFQMLSFGIMKFFVNGQFSPLTEADLTTTLGDMSPSVLFFNFMSYSRPYVILAGLLEVGGGLLLLSRRTVTLGALVLFGVMVNVLMVNLCYNFIQKILSIHLILMLLYLILLDGKGLYQFFILRKPALPNTNSMLFAPLKIKAKGFLKFATIAYMFSYFAYTKYDLFLESNDETPTEYLAYITDFFGVYNIEQLENFSATLPDSLNWKVFYQSVEDKALIKTQNDKLINVIFKPDINKQLFRVKYPQEDQFYELSYEQIDTHKLRIQGNLDANEVDFTMLRIKNLQEIRKRQNEDRLIANKFKWISNW